MSKLLFASIAVVVLVTAQRARAEEPTAPASESCEKDPSCYARELAHILTSSESSVVLERVVTFEPGRVRVYSNSREKLQVIAEQWKKHPDWSVITVHGYSGARDVALGQARAARIRGYLVRYGIPAQLVVAVGHEAATRPAMAAVDLSIDLCNHTSKCARTP